MADLNNAPQTVDVNVNKKKSKATIFIIIFAVAILAAAGAIVFFILNKKGSNTLTVQQGNISADSIKNGDKYLQKLDYSQAIAAYNEALSVDPSNLEAKLKIADAYQQQGDYSKAENAYKDIINSGSDTTKAYGDLAQLYIRKSQLEDAKKLLEEAISKNKSEELAKLYDSTKIETPKYSVQAGSYDTRKTVDLSCGTDDAVIYYTLDGSKPTSKSPVYTDEIVLPSGNTTIKSFSVNSLGYTSDVVTSEYTITATDEKVDFKNKNIEAAVKQALKDNTTSTPSTTGKTPSTVTTYDAERIKVLYILGDGSYVSYAANASFNGKEALVSSSANSTSTNVVKQGTIDDFSDISKLTNLKALYIANVSNVDLSVIAALPKLETLALVNDGITDISALSNLKNLKQLSINWNEVKDISVVAQMTTLTVFSACGNAIEDISAVSGLTKLTYLDISQNAIADVSKLSSLTELNQLWAYSNKISSYSGIVPLRKLEVLMIRDNPNQDKDSLKKIFPRLKRTDFDVNK